MHALEGVRLIDFGQYLAGPFGPMIIGDLGAEVIKVEPVTGDGMRLAGKPFFGCQRGKRDIALDLKTPARARRSRSSSIATRRHRPPQHDRGRREQARHRLRRRASAVNPDIVYCNTWAYGLEGPLARFGGLDPLYQARPGSSTRPARCTRATRRSTTASACATRRTRCSRSSACSPRCTTSSAPARARSCGRRCSTAARCSRPTRMLVDGEPVAAPAPRPGPARASTPATASTGPRTSWIQIAAVKDAGVGRAVRRARRRPSSPTTRGSRSREPAPSTAPARDAARPRVSHEDARSSGRARSTTPACRTRSRSTRKAASSSLFDADNERLGLVAEYEHPIMGTMRQFGELIQFSDTPGHDRTDRRRSSARTPREILAWLGYDDAADRRADRRQRHQLAPARLPLDHLTRGGQAACVGVGGRSPGRGGTPRLRSAGRSRSRSPPSARSGRAARRRRRRTGRRRRRRA